MPSIESEIVFQSYGRCCNSEQFFVDFYDRFMSSSPAIRQRLVDTDMSQQRHLLRNGIMQLVLHARGMPPSKLQALGESHNRHGYNIDPAWYTLWLESLMDTLRKHDPEFSPEIDKAWRTAIQPGIDLIRGAY